LSKNDQHSVYEITIIGRAVWNLHSLSNEGTVGNVTEPRTLTLANKRKTDGISGEILKHMHAEALWALENDKSKFCGACKELRPERANACKEVTTQKTANDAMKTALKCELCDVHGFLVERPQLARDSLVQFGWAVALPEFGRDIHTHARHAVVPIEEQERKEKGNWGNNKCSVRDCESSSDEKDLLKIKGKWYCEDHVPTAQMLYYRPTRSGNYAVISLFQPWRLGLNDLTMRYEPSVDRKERYKQVLKAYQVVFLRPEGAMTATRLPHIEDFHGMIVLSKANYPVPILSPLKDNYQEEMRAIRDTINKTETVTALIELLEFNTIKEFAEKIQYLIEKTIPFSVAFGEV
jgi:CRISPR-associated protein Cst2